MRSPAWRSAQADIIRTAHIYGPRSTPPLAPGFQNVPFDVSATDAQHNHLIYGYSFGVGTDIMLVVGLFLRAEWEYVRFTSHDRHQHQYRARRPRLQILSRRPFGRPRVDRIVPACCSAVSQEAASMKIYGDINSGNCLKVKWVCDHLALPYVWVAIDTLKQETRTQEFLKLNDAGQVPVVAFDDGRTLAQSNAIIRYLARGSDLIPADAFAQAKMDEWLFWEQYSHEPYIAVCRFLMFYLGKPAVRARSGKGQARLCGAGEDGAPACADAVFRRSLPSRSPTSRCWPIRGWRMKAASISAAILPCAAGSARPRKFSASRRRAEIHLERSMAAISKVTIRRTRREDVAVIVGMLADDPLGGARERIEDPLPPSYYKAFETVERDPNIQLVVAEDGEGKVVGCLQLCILPGLEFAGRLARPDRGRPRRQPFPQPRHRRAAGAMGGRGSARQRLQAGRAADASHPRRCAAVL